MTTTQEVEKFLATFHQKVEVFGVFFRDDRVKNRDAIFDLAINRGIRTEVVKSIVVDDYSQGPIIDELNGGTELWVFGKDVNDIEVYIKITLGGFNNSAICISFHRAEYPMNYPFKQ